MREGSGVVRGPLKGGPARSETLPGNICRKSLYNKPVKEYPGPDEEKACGQVTKAYPGHHSVHQEVC